MDYQYKYAKYKQKYFHLRDQMIGGTKKYNLDPITYAFIMDIEKTPGPPIYKLPVNDARNVLNKLAYPTTELPVTTEDLIIPGNISIRIVRPTSSKQNTLPIIMYFHGGGWILGNEHTHARLISEVALGANVAVVFVNYSPAPEAKYPTQINEAYDATLYMVQHANEFNLDSNKLAVMGDSVGGNMAIAVTLLAKNNPEIKIKYQFLFYPVTDAGMDTGSYREFADGPWLTKMAMAWFWDAYEPDVSVRNNILLSPLRGNSQELHGLPPALIITDENDVLRDEGESYAHKLMDAGVEVVAVRYLGICHDYLILNPLQHTPTVKNTISFIINQLHTVFQ